MDLQLKDQFQCLSKEPSFAKPWQELGTFPNNSNVGDQGLKNLAKNTESQNHLSKVIFYFYKSKDMVWIF